MVVRRLCLFFGITGGAVSLWLAVGTFRTGDEATWFGIAQLAMAPVLIGFGLTAPAALAARTREEKTLVITEQTPTLCISAALFIAAIALAAALGGGWW